MTSNETYQLWNTHRGDWCDYNIVGEHFHLDTIKALFPRNWDRNGQELKLELQLIPEPDNPHDPHAISIRAHGQVVGYIARSDCKEWLPVINRIRASGLVATTPGRIYMYERDDWTDLKRNGWPRRKLGASIQVRLGEPDTALPLNDPPDIPYTFVPRSSIVQVTKESDHFDTLFEHVPQSGYGLLIATLHPNTITTARTSKTVVEVRIDGERIGQLTPQMSQRYLPMVEYLRGRGLATACWADITGSAVAAEVRIDAVKANEVDDDTLDGPATTIPSLIPTRRRPGDYDVPDAYIGDDRTNSLRVVHAEPPRRSSAPTIKTPAPAASPIPEPAPVIDTPMPTNPPPLAPLAKTVPPVTQHARAAASEAAPVHPNEGRGKVAGVFVLILLAGLVLTGLGGAIAPAVGAIILILTIPAAILGTIRYSKKRAARPDQHPI